jgi:ribonuclease-3
MTEQLLPPPPCIEKNEIEKLVGTRIRDPSLYQCAFTHKSALKQYSVKSSYETLEFLGDSVLGFVITKILYDNYNQENEGFLTKARTQFVRGKTLADISLRLGMFRFIIMDDKGMRNQWFRNPKIMEDVLEAFIGAIYLDLGLVHVKEFVRREFDMSSFVDDNYKDIVMRWCQSKGFQLPEYKERTFENGMFTIDLYVNGEWCGAGQATTKKGAEQLAASRLLKVKENCEHNDDTSSSSKID